MKERASLVSLRGQTNKQKNLKYLVFSLKSQIDIFVTENVYRYTHVVQITKHYYKHTHTHTHIDTR